MSGNLKKTNEIKIAMFSNFRFRYKDDVHSLNNSTFGDYIGAIYPIELEIKDTNENANYNEGRLRTTIYNNRDDLIVPIVNLYY